MSELRIGTRVLIFGSHDHRGETGEIAGTRGKMFYGWTVRLDSGTLVGAGERQMKVLAALSDSKEAEG